MAKRQLSFHEVASIHLDGNPVDVSREDFRDASAAIHSRLRPVVTRCLRDAGVQALDLDDVLLVGGASRMQVVRDFIREQLKRISGLKMDPDRVVALGAAVQAGLCSNDAAVSDIVLTDVCPHTLGIEMSKNLLNGRPEVLRFSNWSIIPLPPRLP